MLKWEKATDREHDAVGQDHFEDMTSFSCPLSGACAEETLTGKQPVIQSGQCTIGLLCMCEDRLAEH